MFYRRLFLVPESHQRRRPVIDLSRLNPFLLVEKFKMETPESIRASLIPGECVASIDLSNTYLHIPIHPNSRKCLRFYNQSGEVRTQTHSGIFIHGLQIPSRFGPYKTHSREMAQISGFNPMLKVKTCFDCKMFNVANWVACLQDV